MWSVEATSSGVWWTIAIRTVFSATIVSVTKSVKGVRNRKKKSSFTSRAVN